MNSPNQRVFARYIFAALLGSLGFSALMVAGFALAAPAILTNPAFPWLFFASSMLGGLPVFLAARRRQEQKPVRVSRRPAATPEQQRQHRAEPKFIA